MSRFRQLSIKSQRLLLGGFLLYLFGVLGFAGHSHEHADEHAHTESHQECQLCQITAQQFIEISPLAVPQFPPQFALLFEVVNPPILPERHLPFSSRGPPSI